MMIPVQLLIERQLRTRSRELIPPLELYPLNEDSLWLAGVSVNSVVLNHLSVGRRAALPEALLIVSSRSSV